MGNKRIDEVSRVERKALPWALRRTQRDVEEAVSLCACNIVFVKKRKGGRKKSNCMHWRMSVSVSAYNNLFMYCIFMTALIFEWVHSWCVCVQSVMFVGSEHWLKNVQGLYIFHKRLLTTLTLNYICVCREALGANKSQTQEVLQERGDLINSCPSGWYKKTRLPQISSKALKVFPYY